eukprot:358720-Chlamydomonas_euryale.AAC.2
MAEAVVQTSVRSAQCQWSNDWSHCRPCSHADSLLPCRLPCAMQTAWSHADCRVPCRLPGPTQTATAVCNANCLVPRRLPCAMQTAWSHADCRVPCRLPGPMQAGVYRVCYEMLLCAMRWGCLLGVPLCKLGKAVMWRLLCGGCSMQCGWSCLVEASLFRKGGGSCPVEAALAGRGKAALRRLPLQKGGRLPCGGCPCRKGEGCPVEAARCKQGAGCTAQASSSPPQEACRADVPMADHDAARVAQQHLGEAHVLVAPPARPQDNALRFGWRTYRQVAGVPPCGGRTPHQVVYASTQPNTTGKRQKRRRLPPRPQRRW